MRAFKSSRRSLTPLTRVAFIFLCNSYARAGESTHHSNTDHRFYQVDPHSFDHDDRHEIQDFDIWRFRSQVEQALRAVKAVLDNTRNPHLLSDQHVYVYDDKFLAAEFVTNVAIAAYVHTLERLGLTQSILQTWTLEKLRVATLRFEARVSCSYVGQDETKVVVAEHEVERNVTTSSLLPKSVATETAKVKKTVLRHIWDVSLSYNLTVLCNVGDGSCDFDGSRREANGSVCNRTGDKRRILLKGGTNSQTISTPAKTAPVRQNLDRAYDVPLTWLLQHLAPWSMTDTSSTAAFRIDRLDSSCKTPRRNDDVENALRFDREFYGWASQVEKYLVSVDGIHSSEGNELGDATLLQVGISSKQQSRLVDLLESLDIMVPIAPLMDNRTIMVNDTDAVLKEHVASLDGALGRLLSTRGLWHTGETNESLIGYDEATIAVLCRHVLDLSQGHADALNYVEYLLELQLRRAIGRRIQPGDFDNFLRTHYRTFLNQNVALLEPFARSIRQPDHYPDGVLSIESTTGASSNILTLVRRVPGPHTSPVELPINAATTLELVGDRYLHGWMMHSFTDTDDSFQLVARARQFSSFLLVLGSIAGPNEFAPKHAVIVRNKDEFLIPLLTEVLPSAKSFRDAIDTLSPEQQGFAKAFRAMQLQSSVFGVCVIQLKPQLELLLNLPPNALTKEIELTEDLMSLFVDYQVPSDLLSYDQGGESSTPSKIEAVKGHVGNVLKLIQARKQQQLEEERLKTDMRAEKAFSRAFEDSGSTAAGSPREGKAYRRALHAQGFVGSTDTFLAARLDQTADPSSFESDSFGDASATVRHETASAEPSDGGRRGDFTMIPKELDAKLEKYDLDGSLRSVILRASDQWTLKKQDTLLSPAVSAAFDSSDIEEARKRSFDLLDAISRSGTLPIQSSELHVFVAVSHCFEKTIVETVIQDNVDPIERLEESMMLLASTVYGSSPEALLAHNAGVLKRMKARIPELFREGDRSLSGGAELK